MKRTKRFVYEYARPAVTVDLCLLVKEPRRWEILLIQRKSPPFAGRWALPGGFVDENEDLADAARRELLEETAVRVGTIKQLGAYGTPGRDPRGHTIGVAFLALARPSAVKPQVLAGDDARSARFFPLGRTPPLAFDHAEMVRDARKLLWASISDGSIRPSRFAD